MVEHTADAIRAGIDRREALAQAATPGPWAWDYVSDNILARAADGLGSHGIVRVFLDPCGTDDGPHIAVNDPAHVLAVLAAAREELADALAQQERHKCVKVWPAISGPGVPQEASADCECGGDYPCDDAQQAERTLARLTGLYTAKEQTSV